MDATTRTTGILHQLSQGDQGAADQLFPLVYDELRAIAERFLRGQPKGHTLQATALVHEAFLKLIDQTGSDWRDQAHFLAVSATAMRHILVDHARARARAKRGGDRLRLTLDEAGMQPGVSQDLDLLALNDALTRLTTLDGRQGRIVEMRFFGGMKVTEIADVLGVSKTTVDNHWRAARAWLNAQLRENGP